jgi:hypothetical protein
MARTCYARSTLNGNGRDAWPSRAMFNRGRGDDSGSGESARDHAVMGRKQRELQSAGDTQLVENCGEMVFDGVLADRQLPGDLPIAEAGDDVDQDDKLSGSEAERMSDAPAAITTRAAGKPTSALVHERTMTSAVKLRTPGRMEGMSRTPRDTGALYRAPRIEANEFAVTLSRRGAHQ